MTTRLQNPPFHLSLQMAEAARRFRCPQAAAASPAGSIPTDRGALLDVRKEGVGLQQLVRERRGRPDRHGPLQLCGGNQGRCMT